MPPSKSSATNPRLRAAKTLATSYQLPASHLNAVIGYPLEHSLSPAFHNNIYQQQNLNAVMLAFPHQNIAKLVTAIRTFQVGLTAVTMPHKQTIIPFLNSVDPVSKKIGAVNTVINRNGKLYGYNTDVVGIAAALAGTKLKNKKVLILGAGGVARAVAYFLQKQQAEIFCTNRTLSHAQKLMKEFGGKAISQEKIDPLAINVIINTTPLGMYPHLEISPLPSIFIQKHQTVFDLIYNPLETKLLRLAKKRGAKAISGMIMFEAQAREQIRLWSGKK